ncbi:MAG: 6-O-methylguanine DNA methyltransferase/methylated-DNA-[protein]-cysteine S-methyltransferase [Candidatus Shapirobacteria bacterium GW2011_GWE1_38_10]|uniref:6-O-methylguanine DNA methyltransferase/methylated-DNA-[protein]-cysteine S-methyltransferase n=1 Tax=Candidatus Shapirobacteria bacterium GW2011_GWE1_38_10 TaxID=1618488 RepID=A0A0G0I4D7_9BACT|nr:MAG: 6-O-methylguanine DNA methyltransferase/methylated-DNA-[protein]-cysteine S-methyltransferase [Candidatus Shapirobacteria bacterium GW2011_GWF2_37_20]KKQ50173.1 MAG: 6-O-methylguanine DNA methyltransferase/methylated-DNA-[protein]-cysteine S-methyltransferase [Candidatus Shapirobacteria bacterium GW2011_GWE1_38_10]KKQ64766.1 MAG: 6-O-methylguanine DNA methyltransferase/methylated-DNA-[protein]-cysteine S-methyltransferase [Candidatus Shapirobacteria bacterium GW2011_GWF1_38_23]HBP51417.1
MNKGIFLKIREEVKKIPKGETRSYGEIARIVGTNAHVVGFALRGNEDMTIPCHRVIKTNGEVADKFSLGNWPEQKRRLEEEGIKFKGRRIIVK